MRRIGIGIVFSVWFLCLAWPAQSQDDPTPQAIGADDFGRIGVLTLLNRHSAPVIEMAFSPDGSAFITGGLDGQFCVWNVAGRDANAGQLLFCLSDYTPAVTVYAWDADAQTLAITSPDGTSIQLYDVSQALDSDNELAPLYSLPVNEAPFWSLEFVNDGQTLIAADVFDNFVLYAVESQEILNTLEGIDYSANDALVAIVTPDGDIALIDAETGEVNDTLNSESLTHARFSPDGRWLAAWGERTQVWDLDNRNRRPRTLQSETEALQFTPNSLFIATWEGEQVRLWSLENYQVTGTLDKQSGGLQSVDFAPDSQNAITIDSTGIGRLWELAENGTARERLQLRNHVDRVWISPDSSSAIVARHDFAARFYHVDNAQLRGQYEFSPDAEISPDWSLVATRSGSLVIWHGLRNTERIFEWMPIGQTQVAANVRETPDTSRARIAVLAANSSVFALERSADNEWLYILLPDGTQGWLFRSNVTLSGDLEALPISQRTAEN